MKRTYFIIILITTISQLDANVYCSLKCNGKLNSVCKFEPCRLSKGSCKKAKMLILDADSKKRILALHNEKRQILGKGDFELNKKKVQGANINELLYSEELQFSAQCWANQCLDLNDFCRPTIRFSYVGQNYFLDEENEEPDLIKLAVETWWAEREFTPTTVFESWNGDEKYARITQLLWHNTKYLGCGAVLFNNYKHRLLICNYAPAANEGLKSTFDYGKSCDFCNCSATYPNLCESIHEDSKFVPPFQMGVSESKAGLCNYDKKVTSVVILSLTLMSTREILVWPS